MVFATLLVAGCAIKSGNYCDIAQPIWWNDATELTNTPDSIVRQVVKHNETWQGLCE